MCMCVSCYLRCVVVTVGATAGGKPKFETSRSNEERWRNRGRRETRERYFDRNARTLFGWKHATYVLILKFRSSKIIARAVKRTISTQQ